jgi:F-type H+-transporting ATPase subunit gamma
MAQLQVLKQRIGTAKNIRQITKAMEMVSAGKMRRAQQQALQNRPYAQALKQILSSIASHVDKRLHPLLTLNTTGQDVLLLVSTDKSLAGSLNTNLFRYVNEYVATQSKTKPQIIIIGEKARSFVLGLGYDLYAEYTYFPDPVTRADSETVSRMLIKGYLNQEFKRVTIIYMDFISTLSQQAVAFPLLPFPFPANAKPTNITKKEYIFEPSPQQVLDSLVPYIIHQYIYQTLLEAKASEHSARMVAMKNASDNASDIMADLTLQFNKQRQEKITAELIDNTTAAAIVT